MIKYIVIFKNLKVTVLEASLFISTWPRVFFIFFFFAVLFKYYMN